MIQYQEALHSYLIASKLGPGEVLPLVNASIAYASPGQLGPAGQMLQKALALDPGNVAATFNLGALYVDLGRYASFLANGAS